MIRNLFSYHTSWPVSFYPSFLLFIHQYKSNKSSIQASINPSTHRSIYLSIIPSIHPANQPNWQPASHTVIQLYINPFIHPLDHIFIQPASKPENPTNRQFSSHPAIQSLPFKRKLQPLRKKRVKMQSILILLYFLIWMHSFRSRGLCKFLRIAYTT